MTEYAKLVISVDSRPVSKADKDLSRLQQTAGKTEKATDGLGSAFRRLAGPLAAVVSARQIAQAAESYTNLTNRLRLVTEGTDELIAAQEAVFSLAQSARQPLDATAELYQRIATNADALGLSGSGVAAVVDTINKSMAISGTTAASASAAMIQLGQAFASGQLRGQELNSVLEQAPGLASALADGLGVSVGELRKLSEAGQLSADNLIQALLDQGAAVDEKFGKIQVTAGQAFTTLGNSLTKAVGEIDAATGSSAALADGIISLSNLIDSGALTEPIITSFAIWSSTFDSASKDIDSLALDFDALGAAGSSTADLLGNAFKQMPANLRAAVQIATVEVANFFEVTARKAAGAVVELAAYIKGGSDAAAKVASRVAEDIAIQEGARTDTIAQILAERDAIIQAGEAAKQRYADERTAREAAKLKREQESAELRKGAQGKVIDFGGAGNAEKAAAAAEKSAQKLQSLYATNEQQLARQLALFGQTSEAAQVRYEIENGELAKLNTQQQQHLLLLAEELDRIEERKNLEDEVSRIREQSMTDVQRGNKTIQEDYAKINKAYKAGILSEEEWRQATVSRAEAYSRATEAGKESISIMDEFAKTAAENIQTQLADTLIDTFDGSVDDILDSWGKMIQRMIAEAVAADLTRSLFGELGGGEKGSTGWLGALGGMVSGSGGGLSSLFAGFFDRGGPIAAGKFGIVGENGPELVRGPAQVTGREETARSVGGTSISIGNISTNITNSREASRAGAEIGRQVARAVQGSGRYA